MSGVTAYSPVSVEAGLTVSEVSPRKYPSRNASGHVVVGAGGAGVNALKALVGTCDRGIAIDFDAGSLRAAVTGCKGWAVLLKPPLPKSTTRKQRVQQLPAIERALAAFTPRLIKELNGAACVTLIAGLGGRAGSSIGPWVAEVCASLRIPLYAGLIFPAAGEGVVRNQIAEAAAVRIRSRVSVLLEHRTAAFLPKIRSGVLMLEYCEAINELQRRLVLGASRYSRYLDQ